MQRFVEAGKPTRSDTPSGGLTRPSRSRCFLSSSRRRPGPKQTFYRSRGLAMPYRTGNSTRSATPSSSVRAAVVYIAPIRHPGERRAQADLLSVGTRNASSKLAIQLGATCRGVGVTRSNSVRLPPFVFPAKAGIQADLLSVTGLTRPMRTIAHRQLLSWSDASTVRSRRASRKIRNSHTRWSAPFEFDIHHALARRPCGCQSRQFAFDHRKAWIPNDCIINRALSNDPEPSHRTRAHHMTEPSAALATAALKESRCTHACATSRTSLNALNADAVHRGFAWTH